MERIANKWRSGGVFVGHAALDQLLPIERHVGLAWVGLVVTNAAKIMWIITKKWQTTRDNFISFFSEFEKNMKIGSFVI